MSEMSSQSLNKAQTSLAGYSSTMGAAYDQMQDFRKSRGDSLSNDSSIGIDQASSASRSFQKVDDVVDSYSKLMGIDQREAAEKLNIISGGANLTGGIGKDNGLLSAKLSGTGGYEHRRQWTNSDIANVNSTSQEQVQFAQKYTEAMDEVNRVFQNDSLRNSSTEAANFSDGFSSRLSEADSYRKDVQNSLTESEAWQQSANLVSTSSVGVADDLSQEFVNWASYQLGSDGYELGIGGVKDAMDDSVQRDGLLSGYIQSHREQITQSFANNKINDQAGINMLYENSQHSMQGESKISDKYNTMSEVVMNSTSSQGLNESVNSGMQNKAQAQIDANNTRLNSDARVMEARKQQLKTAKDALNQAHPIKDK